MTIKLSLSSIGEEYEAECDECGDTIVDGCEDFMDAIRRLKSTGGKVHLITSHGYSRARNWHHYCADCAEELGV